MPYAAYISTVDGPFDPFRDNWGSLPYLGSRLIPEPSTSGKPTSCFPRFRSLPPELRRAIWRWFLIRDQWRRALYERSVAPKDPAMQLEKWFLPNASLISPLLFVNRESPDETLRRYPHAIRVYRGDVPGNKRKKRAAGRMHMNWYDDAFLVQPGWWRPGNPFTLTLHHWARHVECYYWFGKDDIYYYCFPGHWEARRKRKPDQERMEDIVLGIRNLFV
ncbi:hypothetical protein PG991_000697 [Apiospora marii]|uniref:2EXR domain-containing protein n=1 Tax=Apiospora marii TaxID=335849 RepID=A0ABR1SSP5_9PEZI